MTRHRSDALLHTLAITLFSAVALAQTGLPFSGVPVGGMGNSPGVSFPTGPTVGVPAHIVGPPLRPGPFRSVGTVPIFFGTDEPNSIVINNIVPVPAPDTSNKAPVVQEQPVPSALIIEREGDRWVRRRLAVTGAGQSGAQTVAEPQMLPMQAPRPLPDTTLIFRDGHRENVSTYMIFGGALYHSTPAWAPQQQVQLTQLDLPATEQANRQRGVIFRLPNSPNEVVTRP